MPLVPLTWLDEQTVNTTLAGSQYEPDIIQLANGNILVVWTSTDDTGAGSNGGTDLIGRIYTPDGVPVGAEFAVNNSFTAHDEQDAQIVALPNGNFLVVLEDNETSVGTGNAIRLEVHNSTGALLSAYSIEGDGANTDPAFFSPQVAVFSATSALIVYESFTGGVGTIVARTFNPSNGAVGTQFTVLTNASGFLDPEVVALTNGNFAIVGRMGGADSAIAYRIVDGAGNGVTGATFVTGTNTNGFADSEPTVTALAGGAFSIAYTSINGGDGDVRVHVYNASGTQTNSTFVGTGPLSNVTNYNEPTMLTLADGTFIVVYDNDTDDRMQIDRFTALGSYQGTFTTAATSVTTMSATSLADGRFAVTWVNASGEVSMEIFDTRDAANAPVGSNNLIVGVVGDETINAADGSLVYSGAGNDIVISGGTVNGNLGTGNDEFRAGIGAAETVDGGDGIDLLDLSSWGGDYTINLATGVTNYSDSFTNFENVITGNGNDTLVGNAAANILNGGGGNDTITAGGGDTALGGEGDDYIYAALGSDNHDGGNGIDTLDTSSWGGAYTVNLVTGLTNFGGELMVNFENINGGAGDDTFIGTAGNNIMMGMGGNDYLIGGDGNDQLWGGTGSNTLQGGIGDDFYLVNSSSDGTLELAGEGNDYVYPIGLSSYVMQANVENMSAVNAAAGVFVGIGNAINNNIAGRANVSDELYGLDGNDVLIGGAGGAGQYNTLLGGTGDDTYVITAYGDSTIELAGEGAADEVQMDFSIYGLQANIEILRATGNGVHDALVGNIGNNVIYGGTGADGIYAREGNDELRGGTGAANTMLGQQGDDTYYSDAAGDTVVEFAGEGTDTVRSSTATFTLGANVEHLVATGSTAFVGNGNALDNNISGNVGADTLSGFGGNDRLTGNGGVDILIGGSGDDYYEEDDAGSSFIENAGEGIDTIDTTITNFTLGANFENLVMFGSASGRTGTGNALDNTITGTTGADAQISGLDGNDIIISRSGNDLLLGGNGNDTFRYAGGETGVDRILDFTSGQDKIALRSAFFTPTGTVDLVQGNGAAPTTGNSTFIYDTVTGMLSYDDDGNGAGAAVQIAQLNGGLALAAGDFIFY